MATSALLVSCKNKDSATEILQHLVRAANLALFLLPVLIKTLEYFYLHYENHSFIFYVMQKLRQSDRVTGNGTLFQHADQVPMMKMEYFEE
jgi:hypothetical protein